MNIDISEIEAKCKPTPVDCNMLRIDDLDLLYTYCKKVHGDLKSGAKKPDNFNDYARFDEIMMKLGTL